MTDRRLFHERERTRSLEPHFDFAAHHASRSMMCWPASGVILRTTAWKIWALGQVPTFRSDSAETNCCPLCSAVRKVLLAFVPTGAASAFLPLSHYLLPSARVLFFLSDRTVDQIPGTRHNDFFCRAL